MKKRKKKGVFAKLFRRNRGKKPKKLDLMRWFPSSSILAIGRERASRRRGKKGKR